MEWADAEPMVTMALSLMQEQIDDDDSIEADEYLFRVYECPKNLQESEQIVQ